MLNCYFDLCVYNKKLRCTLKNNIINENGCCDVLLGVAIPDDILEEFKRRQLEDQKARLKILSEVRKAAKEKEAKESAKQQ